MNRKLILYTRPGCHLCDVLLADAEPIVRAFGAVVEKVDIDQDPVLRRKYGWDIPVLTIEGREICRHRLDESALKNALED